MNGHMDETQKELALLFMESIYVQQKLCKALEELSYQTSTHASITEKAAEMVKSASYRVIILEDGMQGIPLRENCLYQEICRLTMRSRRNIFLILVGKEMKHLSFMTAFSMNANLLLNTERIEKEELAAITTALRQVIAWNARLYQAYHKTKERIDQSGR
ncbi:MAG: hypothetical protein ACMUIA_02390 [bacterium]